MSRARPEHSPETARDGNGTVAPGTLPPARRRPRGAPGIGSIFVLAYVVILVPGVAAYILLRLAGLAIGAAGVLGLLVCLVFLGLYPMVLRRLGWVPPRRRPVSAARPGTESAWLRDEEPRPGGEGSHTGGEK